MAGIIAINPNPLSISWETISSSNIIKVKTDLKYWFVQNVNYDEKLEIDLLLYILYMN